MARARVYAWGLIEFGNLPVGHSDTHESLWTSEPPNGYHYNATSLLAPTEIVSFSGRFVIDTKAG